ncbi:MAG TPA: FKBP-type peptidyl-prolyl cis-trans isomerase [Flavisolibacter sp.]|jgi:FKBP-type peptidyl-prolyl cis-trans isomerase FkpA|nr:FKBP-type peptidyl-prolyl cis-trans isomerase [Flavisolibacter sp.]
MYQKLFALFAIVILAGSCSKKEDTPAPVECTYNACAVVAPQAEIDAVKSYLDANSITATQHCSGMFYKIDVEGSGLAAKACSVVAVTYEGKLTNGTVFDSRSTPLALSLQQVIRGWTNGIPLIKAGGRIYLYIPPTLGYGANANGPIPANSILIFRVDLVAVQP